MAELRIIRQTSLATEKFTTDGKAMNVHVLLKDKPFLVEVGRNGSVDLRNAVLEANLFYDSPSKEVEWIKVQPFEYTAKVNSDGSVATLESYIHILSSQNENALFRLRIRALIPAAGASKKDKKAPVGETLEIFSEAIQVISKPSVLRRKHERERAKHEDLVSAAAPAAAAATPINAPSSAKRTRDDVILETLSEIKRQQEQQQRLLESLAAAGSPPTSPAGRSSSTSSPADSVHSSPLIAIEPPTESFETAFKNCIRAFNNLERECRGGKVRKVMRELGASGAAFAEAVWSESFQREIDAQVSRIALLDAPTSSNNNSSWRGDSAVWRITSSEVAATVADADFTDVVLEPTQ
jgi:hypothetical protein